MKNEILLCLLAMAPLTLSAATVHVWSNSPSPEPPYASWASAAHIIQAAVDAAQAGDTVLVTNGVYASGGRAVGGSLTNRVAVDRPITVRSVNGPEVTTIEGAPAPGGGPGPGAFRCVYVGANAVLDGFTLRNGHTRESGRPSIEQDGGGAWCERSGLVAHCIFATNAASGSGGGVFGGQVQDSTLTGNSASGQGGGASGATLQNCTLRDNTALGQGGGAWNSTLRSCTLSGNAAASGGGAHGGSLEDCSLIDNQANQGGGAQGSTLRRCVLSGNTADVQGGGVFQSTLYNCTLTANSADEGGGSYQSILFNCSVVFNSSVFGGGGVFGGTNQNCILYYNFGFSGPNHFQANVSYCCTTPLPANGSGNIKNEPDFVDPAGGDFSLSFGSPCIDLGTNLSAIITNDLDGHPRPLDGDGNGLAVFDMGASEFDLRGLVTDEWLLRYGLDPNDPLVYSADPDNDGYPTLDEWVSQTDPTNALSFFRIDSISQVPPITVSFQSASNRVYTLLYSSALLGTTGGSTPWRKVPEQTAQPGTGGRQELSDTNPVPQRFYRVTVDVP